MMTKTGIVTEALTAATSEGPTREQLIEAGLRRATSFSWARTAELTDATIDALLCSWGRA